MIQLQHYSSVAACSGYTKSTDSIYCCTYARTRVHVPGTYDIIHTLQQQTATAVVVLQLLAVCCLPYAIYSSIDSSVLLLLDLTCLQ